MLDMVIGLSSYRTTHSPYVIKQELKTKSLTLLAAEYSF